MCLSVVHSIHVTELSLSAHWSKASTRVISASGILKVCFKFRILATSGGGKVVLTIPKLLSSKSKPEYCYSFEGKAFICMDKFRSVC